MFWLIVVTFLNSAAIICTVMKNRKVSEETKKELARHSLRLDSHEKDKYTMKQQIRDIYEDVKETRLEITKNNMRKPLSKDAFSGEYMMLSNETVIKEDELTYIANIALKAIESELPEEKRTYEMISLLIEKMTKQLKHNEIKI